MGPGLEYEGGHVNDSTAKKGMNAAGGIVCNGNLMKEVMSDAQFKRAVQRVRMS